MKKKLISAVAAILALTLVVGTTVFAAKSPDTGNTPVATQSDSKPVLPQEKVIPRGPGYMEAGEVRATSDYKTVSEPQMIATIYKNPKNDPFCAILNQFGAGLTGVTKLGAYKIRMYNGANAIWDGFGTFNVNIGVGNKYDGKTATIYFIGKDGQVKTLTAVVAQGKITLPMTEMGSILITF